MTDDVFRQMLEELRGATDRQTDLLSTQIALLERQTELLDEIRRAVIRLGEKIGMPL